MEVILLGLLSSWITQVTKRYSINGNVLGVFFALLFGVIYIMVTRYYPGLVEATWDSVLEIWAISQGIYLTLNKLSIFKSNKEL